ncbi:MAG: N-acetylneuraminate synthase family protein [Candidatus Omnitrophica bacterium]|nr:N-acetylneuraminate synthase family protein [Candidatus Omnitrophota bacterium]
MRKRRSVTIGSKIIGDGFPTFIVAEAGVNHNGDIELAKKLIVEAKQAGADAVKFQGFSAHLLCDLELTETKNVEAITGGTKSSYEMYKRLELSNDDIEELKERAQKEGILFFLSVFDEERADFLNSIDIPCFKISSGDLTHLPLIKHVARSKRPIIISTGMGTLEEVKKAVYAIEKEGNRTIIILHCTADYPPKDEEINLSVIKTMQEAFPYPIGYSDHSLGIVIPIAASAFGAVIIEKHFTLSHDLEGPDHKMSLDPTELRQLISGVRLIEQARGSSVKEPTNAEENLAFSGRRGIKAARRIQKGKVLEAADVKIVKPASGIQPADRENIIGKKVTKDIKRNEPIEWEMVE